MALQKNDMQVFIGEAREALKNLDAGQTRLSEEQQRLREEDGKLHEKCNSISRDLDGFKTEVKVAFASRVFWASITVAVIGMGSQVLLQLLLLYIK